MSKRSVKRGVKGSAGVQALKLAKSLKKQVKKEPRIAIGSYTEGTLSETPVIVHYDVHAGGAGTNGVSIDGVTAVLRSLRIKGLFKASSATSVPCRLDVVLDRRPVPGTVAVYNDIYRPVTASGRNINAMMSPLNKTRFKLLASFKGAPVTNDNQVIFFDRHIRLNHKIASTTANSYTQDNQTKNAVLIAHWAEEVANEPTYKYQIQTVLMDDN